MKIRRAVADDVPAIVAMLADDVLGRTREASDADLEVYYSAFAEMAGDDNNTILVAEEDGAVIGCLQLTLITGLSLSATRRAQIEGVRVASTHRGRNIGERLFDFAIAEARRRGCGLVQLTTNKVRQDAARFYDRLGFEATHIGYKLRL